MFATLSVLAALISCMFVVSVGYTISELRREREDIEEFVRRHGAF